VHAKGFLRNLWTIWARALKIFVSPVIYAKIFFLRNALFWVIKQRDVVISLRDFSGQPVGPICRSQEHKSYRKVQTNKMHVC